MIEKRRRIIYIEKVMIYLQKDGLHVMLSNI